MSLGEFTWSFQLAHGNIKLAKLQCFPFEPRTIFRSLFLEKLARRKSVPRGTLSRESPACHRRLQYSNAECGKLGPKIDKLPPIQRNRTQSSMHCNPALQLAKFRTMLAFKSLVLHEN